MRLFALLVRTCAWKRDSTLKSKTHFAGGRRSGMGQMARRSSCQIVWQVRRGKLESCVPGQEICCSGWRVVHVTYPQRTLELLMYRLVCQWHVQVKPHATVFQYHRPLHKACQEGDISRVKELCMGLAEEVMSVCLSLSGYACALTPLSADAHVSIKFQHTCIMCKHQLLHLHTKNQQ